MKTPNDIRTLTERYFQGETMLEEERLLYQLYQRDDVPQDLLACREMFLDMAALDFSSITGSKPAEAKEPAAEVIPLQHHKISRRWFIAASVALVIGLGSILLFQRSQQEECVAYIYGKKTTELAVVMRELEHSAALVTADSETDAVESQLNEMFNIEEGI